MAARADRTKKPKLPLGALDLSTAMALRPLPLSFPRGPSVPTTILLYTNIDISILDHSRPVPTINDTTFIPQSPPLISLAQAEYDQHQLVVPIEHNGPRPAWVDVIVNNRDVAGHPFHLHGHDFYVLQSCSVISTKGYNPFRDPEKGYPPRCGDYNLDNPARKDTVYIPPLGYVVLRWRADAEGLWMFHCHLLWHHAGGMAMGFEVLEAENLA